VKRPIVVPPCRERKLGRDSPPREILDAPGERCNPGPLGQTLCGLCRD
jgi:hypothetical protein